MLFDILHFFLHFGISHINQLYSCKNIKKKEFHLKHETKFILHKNNKNEQISWQISCFIIVFCSFIINIFFIIFPIFTMWQE